MESDMAVGGPVFTRLARGLGTRDDGPRRLGRFSGSSM